MFRPRWRKVLADLWDNKIRSLLVIASIAVGLFAIGFIVTIHFVISNDIRSSYASVNPANITLNTTPFDDDLVERIRHMQAATGSSLTGSRVKDAEGVRYVNLRLKSAPGEWIGLTITAIHDFEKSNINQVTLEQGRWPPGDQEIVIERNKLADTNAHLGDRVEIELLDGRTRSLTLVGVVHDQTIGASGSGGGFFLAPAQGFIDTDTLASLEFPDTFTTLFVTVTGDSNDDAHIKEAAEWVRKEVEDNGQQIISAFLRRSTEHPNTTYVEAISGVLFLLGLMVVFLSGFLITNTLSALMNQQIKQIGIMKGIGARRYQIISLYMSLIFVFGVLAYLIALPLSDMAARPLLVFLAKTINFRLQGYQVIYSSILLQFVLTLVVPQLAALVPILHGSRITVQEATSGLRQEVAYQSNPTKRHGRFDRWLMKIRRLSRPTLLSLRNVFRQKGRLVLTLITLGTGGAIFIGTFSVKTSLTHYINQISKYFVADVNLSLDRPYRIDRISQEITSIPDVADVEGWAQARCELLLQDDTIGDSISLLGPPANSPLIEPILISGRWLVAGDKNAIVLSERFLSRFPGIKPGDPLRLRVNGDETDWVVVGFFQLAGKSGGYLAYADYDYLSKVIHQPNMANTFRIVSKHKGLTLAQQLQFGKQIEAHLLAEGYHISEIRAGLSLSASASEGLNVLTGVLLIMACLIALVGSIGLTGTMSLNVMERTREIGVMRAIGATDRILMTMVLTEGLVIGLMSWVISSILAFPISDLMSDTISRAIFDAPTKFTFSIIGFVIWLLVVVCLSIIASFIPARNAAQLTIREVLAYE